MSEPNLQPSWVREYETLLSTIDDELKKRQNSNVPEWAKKVEIFSLEFGKSKFKGELDEYRKSADGGHLIVHNMVNLPFRESAGIYLSRFFEAMRVEGKILANRCPKCKRTVFPPRIVCGWCKIRIEDKPENWIELEGRGTVVSCSDLTEREVDRATGKLLGEYHPNAFIRLDGGDEWTLLSHFLNVSPENMKEGMRVEAVWKHPEQRRGRLTDITYFQAIDEGSRGS